MSRFKPQNIVVDTKGTLGNTPLIAIEAGKNPVYENGKRTDSYDGYFVRCVSPKLGYADFKVVLKEKPEIDEENMEVAFTNLQLQVYVYNGQLMLKGTADSVAPFEATEKRIQFKR